MKNVEKNILKQGLFVKITIYSVKDLEKMLVDKECEKCYNI